MTKYNYCGGKKFVFENLETFVSNYLVMSPAASKASHKVVHTYWDK